MNEVAKIGDNMPPNPIDDALAAYGDAIEETNNWLDGSKVESEGQMRAVDALIKQIKEAKKAVSGAEESAAKPIYDAWKAEKAKFKPTLDDLDMRVKGLVAIVGDFKKRLAAQKAEEERAARAEADRLAREAAAKAAQADAGNIDAAREAAEAKQAAEEAHKAASKTSKEQVKGLRKVVKYEITDHRVLLHWIAQNDREAMTAFIEEWARRNHREVRNADGLKVWEDREAY
ncbi:MAG: hypothetical protein EP341_09650 [Sphingomonadales bacterium]|nr:MAG: hypothetical protein EP341_09650 [Sphingomonadales bacterium]